MESLTVKGSRMQQHQRKRQNPSSTSLTSSSTSSSKEEPAPVPVAAPAAVGAGATKIKDNNYKDISSGYCDGGNTVSSPLVSDYHYRKTSAEIVREAKTHLAASIGEGIGGNDGGGGLTGGRGGSGNSIGSGIGNFNVGGARLVSTRRPITPRDPKRQLYGKVAPPGRPPSAFSLRYLQFESRSTLPCLEPIQHQAQKYEEIHYVPTRSGSIGTLLDYTDRILRSTQTRSSGSNRINNNNYGNNDIFQDVNNQQNNNRNNNYVRPQGKLPALLSPIHNTTSLDNLSEETSSLSQSELSYRRKSESNTTLNRTDSCYNFNIYKNSITTNENNENLIEIDEQQEEIEQNNTKDISNNTTTTITNNNNKKYYQNKYQNHHPLMMRQTKSFDISTLQTTSIELSQLNEEDDDDTNKDKNMENDDDDDDDDVDGKRIKCNKNEMKIDENVNMIQQKENDISNSNNNGKILCLTRSNDLLAQSNTETLLDLLKAHNGIKECNEETIRHINAILLELYSRVKGAKGNWRGTILGGLYGLVECTSPKILLAVARVIFALCVTGSNLTGACKLVFKVAKNETNDHLFIDTDVPELLIDGLGRASPLDEPEACIYGYGAVRFLTNASQYSNSRPTSSSSSSSLNNNEKQKISLSSNSNNRQKSLAQRLARHGAVQLMVLHLQILNESGARKKLSGPPLHVLYQLSAALRALAGIPQIFTNLNNNNKNAGLLYGGGGDIHDDDVTCPIIKETTEVEEIQLELACPHLVKAAEISIGELEIQSNIIRTLSILSEHESCCECLSQCSARIGMLLGPTNNEIGKDILEKQLTVHSRLGYILGNIMARFDDARIQLFENDVAMQYLLEGLDVYSKQELTIRNQMGDTVVDVLIKLVRVIANMSVNPDVGYGLASRAPLGKTLLRLLTTVNNRNVTKMTSELEELRIASLGALHNLCFYQDNNEEIQNSSSDQQKTESTCGLQSQISVALSDTLKSGTDISRTEAARVLGNMTRNSKARKAFCSNGGLKAIVHCLEMNDYELTATSSGVLVNLLGDCERRGPFRELDGPVLLRDILQKSTKEEDWLLAAIVCQALWNYLIDSRNVINSLGEDEADCIAGELAEYLDEDRLFKGEQPDPLWEQFATVATDLLEKIQASLCNNQDDQDYQSDEENDNDIGFMGMINVNEEEEETAEDLEHGM